MTEGLDQILRELETINANLQEQIRAARRLVELNPEYAQMSRARIENDAPLLNEVE